MHAETRMPALPGMEPAAVLAASAALFATDVVAARAAARALGALLAQPAGWPTLTQQLSSDGLVARYCEGSFDSFLDQPCELVLVRRPSGDYLLLHRQAPHWRLIGPEGVGTPLDAFAAALPAAATTGEAFARNGAAAAEAAPDDAGACVPATCTAVVLRLPRSRGEAVAALAQLWPMLRATWLEVGLASLFINGGLLLLPLFAMLVYDKVVNNGVFETLWALVIGMCIYLGIDAGMRLVRSWSIERVAAELSERGDERLWQRLQSQTDFGAGGLASFLSEYRNLAASRDFVSANYLMGLADLPFLLLYLLVVGIVAWPLLILLLVLALIYAVAGLVIQAKVNRLGKEAEQLGTRKLAFMSEALATLDVVRTAPGGHLLLRRWRALAAETATLEARRRLSTTHNSTLASGMSTFTSVAVLTLGAYLIEARTLSVGGLIAVNMLSSRAMALVASLFSLLSKWEDFRRATARVEASLEPTPEPARLEKPQTAGRIEVLGLTRRYAGRPTALDEVSFSVAPGERIALLGRPGSGKTTLLRCLAGLATADAGQILIDGVALADVARSDRARWLAYKAQEPALFAGTLDENLRISGCPPEHPRFAQALWASGLEDELSAGRMTLGMLLAERGANLSGGQRQKVALARAFAQPSRILLLDEPTLGLDAEGERLLAERLPALLGDGVLIVSTHSAVLLAGVQRIVALDGGRIVADGPKEKLLRGVPQAA